MPIHSPFLRYFREVARCGSVRLAARRLFVASSAVNRQVLKIEDELGVRLFERTPSGMELTTAGELLVEHIDRVLTDHDRTVAEIKAVAGGGHRPITLVGQESVISRFLPPALVALHADFPEVVTAFKAASGRELSHLLAQGAADVALAFDADIVPGIECIASTQLPVGAVVSRDHPFAVRESVSLEECVDYPIVLPDQTWPLRDLIDRAMAAANVRPNILTSSNSLEFLRIMLDQQFGIGFQTVVGIEAKVDAGELVLVPLATPAPVVQQLGIWVAADRSRSESLQRLLTLLMERLGAYEATP